MANWGHLAARYEGDHRPRKMLSIDGGGIRGLLVLGVLKRLESLLAEKTGTGSRFRLCDFFDYIAGTSTGSVIATCLALGKSVDEIANWYRTLGPGIMNEDSVKEVLMNPGKHPLTDALKGEFEKHGDLSSRDLKTLLLVVTHNNTSDSAWPISSNPFAKYNDPSRPDCNLRIPLWQLVRASTAFPGIFTPEEIELNPKYPPMRFDDGGVSPYINPAFLLYRMATLQPYNLGWNSGENNLLLVSVGTGSWPDPGANVYAFEVGSLNNFLSVVMYGAQVDQDINCRTAGRCVHGEAIDLEIGDLIPRDEAGDRIPLSHNLGRDFLYARYSATLSKRGLERLGFTDIDPVDVQRTVAKTKAGAPALMDTLERIGRRVGEGIRLEDFGSFVEPADESRAAAVSTS